MAHMCAGNNRRLKQICGEPMLICERVSASEKQPRHEPLLPRLRVRKAQTVATRWQPQRGCRLQQLCFTSCSYLLFNKFPAANLLLSLHGHCIKVWSLCQCSVLASAYGNSTSAIVMNIVINPPPPLLTPPNSLCCWHSTLQRVQAPKQAGCWMVI